MNKFFFFLIFLTRLQLSYSQDVNKNIDFIIVIDEKVAVGAISLVKINSKTANEEIEITPDYYPGNLSITQTDYERLFKQDTKSIMLSFTFNDNKGKRIKSYRYQIELKKEWMSDYFIILNIYNLDKKKYRKRYLPLSESKNYTFEIVSPSNTFLRVPR